MSGGIDLKSFSPDRSSSWPQRDAPPRRSRKTPDLATLARAADTPEIRGWKLVWLAHMGDVAKANTWRKHHLHQTEGGGVGKLRRRCNRRKIRRGAASRSGVETTAPYIGRCRRCDPDPWRRPPTDNDK